MKGEILIGLGSLGKSNCALGQADIFIAGINRFIVIL
jgi:hypothetical protein